jgi:hypothetical protein
VTAGLSPLAALMHCAFFSYAGAGWRLAGSDGEGKAVEGDAEAVAARGLGGDVVVVAAQVLHEGMTRGEHPRGAMALQPAHWPQPRFQAPVVRLDRVVACRSTVCRAEGTSSSSTRG